MKWLRDADPVNVIIVMMFGGLTVTMCTENITKAISAHACECKADK